MTTPYTRVVRRVRRITAWRTPDGLYALHGKTYPIKEKIKSFGGRWDAEKKCWFVSRECVDAIGALRMIRVRVPAHCHEKERIINVTHEEAEAGIVRLGCGWCDTSFRCGSNVSILEILGEHNV